MTDFQRELQVAIDTAREAGALLRDAFGTVREARYKGLVDPVTVADRASEALIAERLLSTFPDDRLLAEEGSGEGVNPGAARLWVVDPLDGTVNFLHAYPVFCVSIGFLVGDRVMAGAVYDPLRDEMFAAAAGQGATLNGAPIAVSDTDTLLRSMLCTGFAYDVTWRQENLRFFDRFVDLTQAVRRDGAAALDLAYVAAGRFDGYWERGVSAWDVAAASLILAEAGGTLSRYDGSVWSPFSREVVASNGRLHSAMLSTIEQVSAGLGHDSDDTVDYT